MRAKPYIIGGAYRYWYGLPLVTAVISMLFPISHLWRFSAGKTAGIGMVGCRFSKQCHNCQRASLYTKALGVFTDVPKTKNSYRSMKLPECIFPTLQQYKIEQAERRLKLGDKWINSDRLFTIWNGKPQNPSCMPKALKGLCDKRGLRYLGIHSFRHLNASLLITSGVDVRTVSASLGHSQTSTTLDIYSHTFEAIQAQAANAVADALPFKNTKKA